MMYYHLGANGKGWGKVSWARQDMGADAYLCCPGPSLPIVERGRGRKIFAINTAYPKIKPDIWMGLDKVECYDRHIWGESFIKVCRGNYTEMKLQGKLIKYFDNVFFASIKEPESGKDMFDYLDHENSLVWHKNTLATMLHLIIKMGAKTIYLVGCDMGGAKDYYDDRVLSANLKAHNRRLYSQQIDFIKNLSIKAKNNGINIISATPNSPLNEFLEYKELERAIEESENKVAASSASILHCLQSEKPLKILSACDSNYASLMQALVKSVLKNTKLEIKVDYLNTNGMPQEIAKDYCANYRLQMFLDNFDGEHNLLWLDADSLVRKDISQLNEWLENYDCLATHTPEMGPKGHMNHWLISTVGISKHARSFLDCWKKEHDKIYDQWKPSIMTVQQSFINALEISKAKIKDIGYSYSDKFMSEDSPIWEAQGLRKKDPKWIEESSK